MGGSNIRKNARLWLLRIQTAQDLESFWPDFEAWLRESPKHWLAYQEEEKKWFGCDSLRQWALEDTVQKPDSETRAVGKARRHRQVPSAFPVGAVVASCILLTTAVWIGLGRGRVEVHTWVSYSTDAAQITPVSLDDGSVVQLNAHSQIRTRLTSAVREVALDKGEAYFDVSPEPARAFNVVVGSVVVRAIGTAFCVKKIDNGQIETAVRRGMVEVKSANPSQGVWGQVEPHPNGAAVGQLVTITPSGAVKVVSMNPVEMRQRLAWANPVIFLHGTLGEAVAQFNRYNVRKLVIHDAELAEIPISGRYRATEPEAFVEALETLGIAHVMAGSAPALEGQILLRRNAG